MRPTFESADLLLIRGTSSDDIKVGDIIVFDVPSPFDTALPSPIVHRIIDKQTTDGKDYYKTKGDFNADPEPFSVPAGNVIGEYSGIKIPLIGHISTFIKTPLGLTTITLLFAMWSLYGYTTYKKNLAREKA